MGLDDQNLLKDICTGYCGFLLLLVESGAETEQSCVHVVFDTMMGTQSCSYNGITSFAC